jgi:MoaA/NifB/PqqE/SkfB family radical SAM enzyme
MKAKIESSFARNRQELHEIVPLKTPFTVIIEASGYCNLKCVFCKHSLSKEEMVKNNHDFGLFGRDLFNKFTEQIAEFGEPIKSISFVGEGEPLVNKNLGNMIKELSQKNLAERITVISNGLLLSHERADELADSGLEHFKISVNGLNAEDYKKNCGRDIDFDKFVSNISYFYNNKKGVRISIKTLDTVLGDRSEQEFYDIFGDICDQIVVEHAVAAHPGVDYSKILKPGNSVGKINEITKRPKVCPALFYQLFVSCVGDVYLCCSQNHGITTENLTLADNRLYDIWHSELKRQACIDMLKQDYSGVISKCKSCITKNNLAYDSDYLDPYTDEILSRLTREE